MQLRHYACFEARLWLAPQHEEIVGGPTIMADEPLPLLPYEERLPPRTDLWIAAGFFVLSAAPTVRALVMSNVRLWTFKSNPSQPLMPLAINRLAEVRCPSLVILGEQDLPHIKDVAGLLVKGIDGARLVIIPRAGHIANLDAPQAFNQALDSFLASR